ncbi:hypothetical protein BFW38_08890 [Terasakiispira papahanaumokuakeensis]|uniref:Uncharacterized protein n=1 Tax=Terasakiispira papahanaumokuakeensis TaxID=197479 RepID=A0A1E2V9P0_9GAMM|nr:hypothetical protein [Terasakiispira papahanaumokuakeensis]ODC03643.1 hypothetical protein BFW38_08890 [Terasakiispira papahanaumokuakeensis]
MQDREEPKLNLDTPEEPAAPKRHEQRSQDDLAQDKRTRQDAETSSATQAPPQAAQPMPEQAVTGSDDDVSEPDADAAASKSTPASPSSKRASEAPQRAQSDASSSSRRQASKRHAAAGSGQGLSLFALLVALGGVGFGGWQYLQVQKLQNGLLTLGDRVEELELQLSATGKDLSSAGEGFRERLDTVDSEIRKLWDLSNKRNRPNIESLQGKVERLDTAQEGLSGRLEKQTAQLQQMDGRIDQMVSTLRDEVNAQAQRVTRLQDQLAPLQDHLDQLNTRITVLPGRLDDQKKQLDSLRNTLASMDQRLTELAVASSTQADQLSSLSADGLAQMQQDVKTHQEQLRSLEASRRQLTRRVTQLMDQLRQMQTDANQ